MARRYLVRAVTEFSAAHVLHGYAGACNRVHGHNFRVELEVEAMELDAIGMALDFTVLEQMAAEVARDLDHRLLNEVPPFDEVNPTAEHVAAHFYVRLHGRIASLAPDRGTRLIAVTVQENARSSVTLRVD